jgi:RimJ/RimL family protein N-acetyltransferase
MLYELNDLEQAVGLCVGAWKPPPHPQHEPMQGRFCRLEPLALHHAESLHAANALDKDGRNWTYLPYGPFDSSSALAAWIDSFASGRDPQFYAIVDLQNDKAVGVASFMRIKPQSGAIEVGHINYSPLLQRTPAATEAMYLMMARAFDLGYRRYEWKCDALNRPSRAAAQRLGFSFEGVFRQALVVKGRNRDTAWYAAMDHDWPALKAAFLQWLSPSNFDGQGRQRVGLSTLTESVLSHGIREDNRAAGL